MGLGGWLDRVILSVSPDLARRRAEARLGYELAQARHARLSTYSGAAKTRQTKDWRARKTSADSASLPDLDVLIARARQMGRDNPYGRSIRKAFGRNVIGTGITPTPSSVFGTGNERKAFNEAVKGLFFEWANDPRLCDVEGRKTFWAFQRMAVENLIEAGQFLVVIHQIDNGPGMVNLRLQGVEPEQLDMTLIQNRDTGHEIRGGVEIDSFKRPVAYWINAGEDQTGLMRPSANRGGSFRGRDSVRVGADRVIDLMEQERAGQTRGVTALAPVLRKLRDLGEYDDVQLWNARLEACIGLEVQAIESPDAPIGGIIPSQGVSGGDDGRDDLGNLEINIEPGSIPVLNPGESIKPFIPGRPGAQYEPFIRQQIRAIAAGSDLSYEQVARDFSNGNFSSQRQALLEDRRGWECTQQDVQLTLCRGVYREVVTLAVLQGLVSAPRFFSSPRPYLKAEWRPHGWQWIDPAKEAAAAKISLETGLANQRGLLNMRGEDWTEMNAQRKIEKETTDSDGVPLPYYQVGRQRVSPVEPRPTREPAPSTPDGSPRSNGNGRNGDGDDGLSGLGHDRQALLEAL